MGLTLQPAVAEARTIINDTAVGAYRYSDVDLLQYANDALDQALKVVPNFFYAWGEMTCATGETMQAVSFADAHVLGDAIRVKNGNALRPFDKLAMDAFNPNWHYDTAAAAENWARVSDDPVRFWIYPPPPASQVLEVMYVKVPAEYAAADDTGLPTTMLPAIVDYIVYMAESRDDEHVNSTRAAQFFASFTLKLKGAP